MEEFCAVHPSEHAVGKCSDCRKPHCLDCLDMETGQVLCPACKAKRAGGAASVSTPSGGKVPAPQGASPDMPMAPPAASAQATSMGGNLGSIDAKTGINAQTGTGAAPKTSPFDFKGKGLDDDPLGLMNMPTAPPVPRPAPPLVPQSPQGGGGKPFIPDLKPLAAAPAAPRGLDQLGEEPPSKPSFSGPPEGSAPPLSYPLGSISGLPAEKPKPGAKLFYLWKTWSKYLVRRAYETFDPLARILRLPTFAAIALVAGLLVGLLLGVGFLLRPSSVKLVEILAPLHLVRVGPGQITDLDVTSYMDLQSQVQNLGFTPLTQLTVTQLPSTNYFDVWSKEEVGAYGEILKFPNQITPRLSFVTVFTSGLWLATNSWQGGRNEEGLLSSECFPNAPADQLYVKHVQRVEKLKKEGLQVALMGENRYMAALSDHLRWYLDKKGLPAYKAEFTAFH